MTDGNPIVTTADGKISWAEGAGLLQDANDLVGQIQSDQWAAGLTTLLSAGLNIKAAVQDPMAKLISWGLGWAIEFFDPLNAWLDWLSCDQDQLTVAAETWSGISAELRTVADELDGYYKTDAADWSGGAVEQYRIFCADRVNLYNAAAGAAAATANLINRNKILLTIVRSIVRDLITDGVGKSHQHRVALPAARHARRRGRGRIAGGEHRQRDPGPGAQAAAGAQERRAVAQAERQALCRDQGDDQGHQGADRRRVQKRPRIRPGRPRPTTSPWGSPSTA